MPSKVLFCKENMQSFIKSSGFFMNMLKYYFSFIHFINLKTACRQQVVCKCCHTGFWKPFFKLLFLFNLSTHTITKHAFQDDTYSHAWVDADPDRACACVYIHIYAAISLWKWHPLPHTKAPVSAVKAIQPLAIGPQITTCFFSHNIKGKTNQKTTQAHVQKQPWRNGMPLHCHNHKEEKSARAGKC